MLALFRGETRRFDRRELWRLLLVQLLIVVMTYAPLFWGILHVPSGLTAVLDLTLMPVSLIGFGIALGEESWSLRRALALGLGFVGLAVLFGPRAVMPTDPLGLLGAAAIVFSAVVYSLGSVVARPLAKTTNSPFLSGITMLLGGLILTLGAWAFEPGEGPQLGSIGARPTWKRPHLLCHEAGLERRANGIVSSRSCGSRAPALA